MPGGVAGARVVEPRVVLAEQIPAVVVAVGHPDHRVDVAPRGRVIVEGDAALALGAISR
jgi:hypothetical protein